MAQNDSVFKPLTPEQMQGPFSGFLQPTHGQQQAAEAGPPVLAGKGTSLGYIANKFIQGAMEGRIKAFERSENEKWQRYQGFSGFVQNIMPSLTVEGQQYILSQLSQVMGAHGREAAGGGTGKGKKGQKQSPDTYPSAGGKVLATGNASAGAEGAGVMHHVTNALKDLFTGMTGGPTPKGGIDVGGKQAEISAKLFDENGQIRPEFSRSGVVQANLTEANRILDLHPPGTTIDVAYKSIAGQMQKLLQYAPDQYAAMQAAMANRFPRGPQTPGQKYEWEMENRMLGSLGGGQPPGQAGDPQSNVGPPVNYTPIHAGPPGAPRQAPQAGVGAAPGPPKMGDLWEQNFYVKNLGAQPRQEGFLQSSSDPANSFPVYTDPRSPGGYFRADGTPVPKDLIDHDKLGYTDKLYHAPAHNPIHKMNEVKQKDGTYRTQVYNDQTQKYEIVPGVVRIPEHEMAMINALERRDEHFADEKLRLYWDAAKQIHSAERFWDSKRDTIERSQDTNLDKPKELAKNEGLRAKELGQINTDRDQLVTQLASSYHKALDWGDSGGGGLSKEVKSALDLVLMPGKK